MAGEIVNHLQQVSGVGGLGDLCSGGKRCEFQDPIGQLRGGVLFAVGLPSQFGLDVGRQPAGPCASEEVVRHVRCQALQVAQELRRFAVPNLFVREELADALVPGC